MAAKPKRAALRNPKNALVDRARAMTKSAKASKDRPLETSKVAVTKEGEDLHERAMRHANEAWLQEFENIDKGRDDQRFYAGEQWPMDALQQRRDENRPVITINRLPGFVRQLTGDVRQNTPSVKVLPAHGEASREVAKIFNGLIRNIETESNAKQAYVKGVENAAICGIGGWRITTQYSSDDGFDQDIRIKRITDPFSILMDPMAREADKSDARYGFVFEDLSKEEFAERYPDQPIDSMPTSVAGAMSVAWTTADTVKVAEYWYRETRRRKLQLMSDGAVRYADEAKPSEAPEPGEPPEAEATVAQERDVDAVQIKSLIMNGKEVLGGPYDWAGRYIPICVVTGEEIYFDGRVVRRGMVRDAKDPQRVYNYTRTAAVEAVAMQPKSPFTATKEQVKGYERQWDEAGSKNLSVLIYNSDPKVPGPPQRVQPAITSTGLDIQSQLANDDMKGVTGIYDASLGQKSNETSGRAILARQKEGDTGTFHFIDNLGVAIEHCGRILVDLIPKIYDSTRIVRTLEEDGSEEMVPINVPHPSAVDEQGEHIVLNDLSVGEYDVVVSTGPSYATKRQEAAESLTEFMRTVPQSGSVIADLVAKNMDWPGADEIAARLKKMLPPGITEEGPPQPPPPPPDLVAKLEKTKAEVDLLQAKTDGQHIANAEAGATLLVELQQMHATMASLMQALTTGQPILAAPAAQAPGAPIPPIVPPVLTGPAAAPAAHAPSHPQAAPPMGELEPMQQPGA